MENELNKLSVFGCTSEPFLKTHIHVSRQDVENAKRQITDKYGENVAKIAEINLRKMSEYSSYKLKEHADAEVTDSSYNRFHWELDNEDLSKDPWDRSAKDMYDEIVQSGLDQNYPNDAYHLMLNFKHDLVSPEFYTAQNSAKKVPRKCRTIFKKILYSGEEEIDWLAVARIPEELDEKLLPYVGLIPAGQLVDFYYKCSFGMEFCEKSFEPLLIALQVEYWKNGNTELLDHLCGAGTQYYLVLRNLLEWHNLDDHYLAKCCMFISMLSQNYKFVEVYTLIHNYLGDMPSELSDLSDWSSKEINNLPDWSINEFIYKDSYLKLYRKYFFYKPTADQCALLGSSAVLFDQCNLKVGNFAHLVASSYNMDKFCRVFRNRKLLAVPVIEVFPVIRYLYQRGVSFQLDSSSEKGIYGLENGLFSLLLPQVESYCNNISEDEITELLDDSCIEAVKFSVKRIVMAEYAALFSNVKFKCDAKKLDELVLDIIKKLSYYPTMAEADQDLFYNKPSTDYVTGRSAESLSACLLKHEIFEFEFHYRGILFAFLPIEFLHSFAHFLKSDSKYDSMQYCLNFIQGKVVIHAFPDRIQRDKYFLGNINRVFWNKGTILSVEEAAKKYVSGDPVLSDSETELLDYKANTIVKSLYYLYCIKGEDGAFKILWNKGKSGINYLYDFRFFYEPGENLAANIFRFVANYKGWTPTYIVRANKISSYNPKFVKKLQNLDLGKSLNGTVIDEMSGKTYSLLDIFTNNVELQKLMPYYDDFHIEDGVLYVK